MSRTIAIAGAKGGVGKTTTTLNLGAALASRGHMVGVIELDLAMGNFVDFLEIEGDPEEWTTMHDVLAGEKPLREASYRAPGGFAVFPSGTDLDGYAETSLDSLSTVLTIIEPHFDVILLDIGAGVSKETVRPLQFADEVVLVSTPRVASVRDTDKTKALVDRVGGSIGGLVLTKSGTGNSPDAERIAEFLSTDLFGHVPHDESIPRAQDDGEPIVVAAPDAPASRAYREIAAGIETHILHSETGERSIPEHEKTGSQDGREDHGATTPENERGQPRAEDPERSAVTGRRMTDGRGELSAWKERRAEPASDAKTDNRSDGDQSKEQSGKQSSRDRTFSDRDRLDDLEQTDASNERGESPAAHKEPKTRSATAAPDGNAESAVADSDSDTAGSNAAESGVIRRVLGIFG